MSSGHRSFPARIVPTLILVVLLLAGTGIVSGHAPLGVGSNEDIAHATLISSPEKSFVLYTELHKGGETQYYLFPMLNGQVLYGSVQVPGPGSMVPDIVIIGPGIEPEGEVPSFVQVPAGSGAMLVPGKPPGKPAYEPFSPQPVYEVARFNVTVPRDGDYYIAISGPEGGKYSLAPGFLEQFTVAEWLLIPWSVITIHLWEGQLLAEIFAPMAIVLIGGLAFVVIRQKREGTRMDPMGWLILISGLLYIGGAAMTGWQVVHTVRVTGYTPAIIVSFVFIAGPLIFGILLAMVGIRYSGQDSSGMSGIKLILLGLIGLLVWAGLIIGPVLALASGLFILAKHARKGGPA
jgi:hypothetical protein